MENHRRFTLNFFFAAGFSIATLLYFNYTLDPNNRYHFNVSGEDLKLLSATNNSVLIVPDNYDDRILLKKFIEAAPKPAIAIIGGSRVMNLQIPGVQKGFLNAGVTSGTIKDYIAIWQIMKQNGKIPPVIILGIDPQALNPAEQNTLWLSLSEYYQAFLKTSASGRYYVASLTSQLKDLLSLQTLRRSIARIGKKHTPASRIPISQYDGNKAARTSSFAMVYPHAYEQTDPEAIRQKAKANGEGELKAFKHWNRKDPECFDQLKALLADMQKHGVRIYLVLMPYHPSSIHVIMSDPIARLNLETFRKELIETSHLLEVPYYDGFNDAIASLLTNKDFSDGVHLKAASNQSFLKRICKTFSLDYS